MAQDFFSLLIESMNSKGSLLCVGLDPQDIPGDVEDITKTIVEINKRIIRETYPYAACYKPNIAFYEAFGHKGLKALELTIQHIPEDTPVILDTKRSDIGNTAGAYARGIFENLHVHATTLNPYLGRESVLPFLKYKDRGLFLLCRTTNPGSNAIQELEVHLNKNYNRASTNVEDHLNKNYNRASTNVEERHCRSSEKGSPLYLHIAREVCSWGSTIGLVVAGNDPAALKAVREILPDIWILAPGIGAQGGVIDKAIAAGIRNDGYGLIINVSRSIARASSPGEMAKSITDLINDAKKKTKHFTVPAVASHAEHLKKKYNLASTNIEEQDKQLIRDIIDQGCFKTGSFTLKSGIISPFYIDLRLLITNPVLLARVADAYCALLKDIEFNRIAGIPFAGIPIATSIALKLLCPMIFPRLTKKAHGSGNIVEGEYRGGEKIVLIDDLITTGKSKFEALDILNTADLTVNDLVVLIERGTQGREELAGCGVHLHACFTVNNFIHECREMNMISGDEHKVIEEFLEKHS